MKSNPFVSMVTSISHWSFDLKSRVIKYAFNFCTMLLQRRLRRWKYRWLYCKTWQAAFNVAVGEGLSLTK